jgi:glucosamine--fructose-6-phosphate aminotransferase (isomerizing)
MCGIVGYVGKRDAQPILLNGLKRLEYRVYDSAEVATVDEGKLHLRRSVGKVNSLESALASTPALGHIGVAHTRWATHGGPSEKNAHPHLDASDRIAIVHNGIIENHGAIRQFLEKAGNLLPQ